MNAQEQHNLRDVSAPAAAETPHRQSKADEFAAMLEAYRGERHIVVL
jgi:hypothetical protein